MSAASDVDVALVTEGTYPFHHGGVSVWCDQLVRGLPDQRFAAVAITGSAADVPVMSIPDNLVDLRPIVVWETPASRGPRARGGNARAVANAHDWLVAAITSPHRNPERELLGALGRLHELSQQVDVGATLRSEASVRRVFAGLSTSEIGQRDGSAAPTATVGDALAASDLLEHFLRPLWEAPPKARLTHCVSNGLAGLVGMAAKWTHGTPMVLTEHGVYLRERYLAADSRTHSFSVRAFVLRFYRLLTGACYRVADLITPGSEYNRRWQIQVGAESDDIQPVHNGVDPALFPAATQEPDEPTLAWAGRVDPLKDIETLVRAFALVRERVPNARLRMFGATPAGNEPYRTRCEALIRELGLDGAAVFEGRVPEIRDAYLAGHVIVLSSASEGFPYTVIEAMASARATVSTDVGGVSEAVGEAGLIVPPRDPRAMADACVQLLTDDALRHRLADAARNRILDLFTLERFLGIYREIYADLAGDPRIEAPVRGRRIANVAMAVGAAA
jgi:polysaccharide biosynthesis protein PelF